MPRQGCLTSVRFAMVCDIVSPYVEAAPEEENVTTGGAVDETGGHWEWKQDEESGAFVKEWVYDDYDDPTTPNVVEGTVIKDVPLFAEGFLDGGLRTAGSTEKFSETYENLEWVSAVFPVGTAITKRHRVYNIRSKKDGEVLWKEDEIFGAPPTVFNVMGVQPVIFMGKIIEKSVLLQRAEVQGSVERG